MSNTVVNLQANIGHLPTKTSLAVIVGALIAVIGIVAIAYWNGVSGKFEAVNTKLDTLSKAVDRLTPLPQSQPPPPTRQQPKR